jgi:hypothetical protein
LLNFSCAAFEDYVYDDNVGGLIRRRLTVEDDGGGAFGNNDAMMAGRLGVNQMAALVIDNRCLKAF